MPETAPQGATSSVIADAHTLTTLQQRWPTHRIWRSRDEAGRPAGWYATAHDPAPGEDRTVGADTARQLELKLAAPPDPAPRFQPGAVGRW
ncbi:hypothetical protein [Allonocardiopsis opalescens]|uniref:hypothetical protein n=1 Tax=Allonocardiopsis opalescens TaxID=1144618 RepID=UPI0011B24EC3|nr:hypothetical protein [Allonocardiopsis opalescens]